MKTLFRVLLVLLVVLLAVSPALAQETAPDPFDGFSDVQTIAISAVFIVLVLAVLAMFRWGVEKAADQWPSTAWYDIQEFLIEQDKRAIEFADAKLASLRESAAKTVTPYDDAAVAMAGVPITLLKERLQQAGYIVADPAAPAVDPNPTQYPVDTGGVG